MAYDTLGDGLIYLMVAENLCLNGFEVTFYGKQIADLREWLPQFRVERYSTEQDLESELGRHDLVLYSPPSFVRQTRSPDDMQRLAERYVLICNSPHIPDYWRYDHTKRIKNELPPEKAQGSSWDWRTAAVACATENSAARTWWKSPSPS